MSFGDFALGLGGVGDQGLGLHWSAYGSFTGSSSLSSLFEVTYSYMCLHANSFF